MILETDFTRSLQIEFPIVMAPMFLVSNEAMMKAAVENGIMGVFPTLNFRETPRLKEVLRNLNIFKAGKPGNYGVNIIAEKTNIFLDRHLTACVEERVPFYITSLGNPKNVIEAAHAYGAKVYCDVTNMKHAEKAAKEGCDGFIAVGQGAGGHAGPHPLQVLVPLLRDCFPHLPVIGAGGIADGRGLVGLLALGASGVSVGTRFIASEETEVNNAYKKAVQDAGIEDIVMTERLSGTPCSIIDTPFARKIGYKQTALERFLSKNPRTKKYFKALVQLRGMKKLEQSLKPGNYKNLWSAGKSSALIHDVLPCAEIIDRFRQETDKIINNLAKKYFISSKESPKA